MWPMSIMGLMTALRVLPEDLYHKVMETDEPVEKGSVFEEIVRRFGNPRHVRAGENENDAGHENVRDDLG